MSVMEDTDSWTSSDWTSSDDSKASKPKGPGSEAVDSQLVDTTDARKIFVGGISWGTTEEGLTKYFDRLGNVEHVIVMRDKFTQRSRGFAFVTFKTKSDMEKVMSMGDKLELDGRKLELRAAVPRGSQPPPSTTKREIPKSAGPPSDSDSTSPPGPTGPGTTSKVFVGGLPGNVNEEELRRHFAEFGTVTEALVIYDHETKKSRGFGFVTFDSAEPVEKVMATPKHVFGSRQVECKRTLPRSSFANRGRGGGPGYRGGRGGGSHGDFGGYGRGGPGVPGGPQAYGSGYGGYDYGYGREYEGYDAYGAGYGGYGAYGAYGDYGGYGRGGDGAYGQGGGYDYGAYGGPTPGPRTAPPLRYSERGYDLKGSEGHTPSNQAQAPASSVPAPSSSSAEGMRDKVFDYYEGLAHD